MEKQSRKDFLANTSKYALGAAVGVAGLNFLVNDKIKADGKAVWPYPYAQLDVEDVRKKAHYLYWHDMDCCSGAFGGLVEALREKIGEPWTSLPIEVMLFGRGGGNGWGTLCGAINGGAALISLAVPKADSGKLINELWGWYASNELPTDASNDTAVAGNFLEHKYDAALPQNVCGSTLCHVSVSDWCNKAKKKFGDLERKERCARVTGDAAAKVAEILNAHYASTFVSTFTTTAGTKACMGCHGSNLMYNVNSNMDCQQCHGDPHSSTDVIREDSPIGSDFQLNQNYPNPFNPTTQISFSLPRTENVSLIVYDINGNEIKRL
ncbi:MAG: C-GCAxxG-C-C family (seleno)protein, partial [Melioribacteraceae bacterium]